MQPVRRAVIDIGTNSIKLLVADVAGREVQPIREQSRQTRLGQGFYQSHRLQSGPITSSAEAVVDFANVAQENGVQSVRVIATSAARDAVNAAELIAAIEEASGLDVEVLTGEQEADWAFRGVTTDSAFARESLLIIDTGGGSTEFVLGQGEQRHFSCSCALGTVRLLERLPHSEPPRQEELAACREWVARFLKREVAPELQLAMQKERVENSGKAHIQFVGTGGTASILGCMEARLDKFDRPRLEQTRLTPERLSWHTEHLWSLPLEARRRVVGLPANRADVILTGTVIYETVIRVLGFSELRVSTRGLRFAALLDDGSQAPPIQAQAGG